MAISTNSVIHYTQKFENLKGIFSSGGFRLKYCIENLEVNNSSAFNSALPMISFCDIPLSEVKNHVDSYGSYGIGLSKIWAKKTGLNPVLYLAKESVFTKNLNAQYNRIMELRKSETKDSKLQTEFINFLSYCKNYEGELIHGKINTQTYRFYDEREWRYVATLKDLNDAPRIVIGEKYLADKDKFNSKLIDCIIPFSHEDISYIIVDDENDIPEILKVLNTEYEDKCTAKELKILSTKIITQNQIYNDF
jgi:hypothetical protein